GDSLQDRCSNVISGNALMPQLRERPGGASVVSALLLLAGISQLAAAADVELWRLDCGEFPPMNIEEMSDTFDYPPGRTKVLTDSCYVIRHGHDYMLWDTGFSAATAEAFKVTAGEPLKAQLSRIGLD